MTAPARSITPAARAALVRLGWRMLAMAALAFVLVPRFGWLDAITVIAAISVLITDRDPR